jgi:hypothetical protein
VVVVESPVEVESVVEAVIEPGVVAEPESVAAGVD